MSHDALCPSLGKGALPVIDLCACRLIARVREDEFSYKGDIDTAYGQGWNEALDAAREAVAALPEYQMRDTCIAAIEQLRREEHDEAG